MTDNDDPTKDGQKPRSREEIEQRLRDLEEVEPEDRRPTAMCYSVAARPIRPPPPEPLPVVEKPRRRRTKALLIGAVVALVVALIIVAIALSWITA